MLLLYALTLAHGAIKGATAVPWSHALCTGISDKLTCVRRLSPSFDAQSPSLLRTFCVDLRCLLQFSAQSPALNPLHFSPCLHAQTPGTWKRAARR